MSIDKYYGQYTPTCDYCEEQLPGEMEWEDARKAMKDSDWVSVKQKDGGHLHYCPECWREIMNDTASKDRKA